MDLMEIKKMSTSERLQTMEALWDALCHEGDGPDSPDWHGRALSDRRERIQSGEARFLTVEEAREHLER
jgi:hypothetical protein